MQAIHVNWSLPITSGRHRSALEEKFDFSSKNHKKNFNMLDYDILLTMLSALKWKQLNGKIKLYADSVAASFYERIGIIDIWDEVNTDVLDQINSNEFNPTLFWSAGKFFAYSKERSPFVMLDTDLIVWRDISPFYESADLYFTHFESVERSYWYTRRKDLNKPINYHFKKAWHWNDTLAYNNAITYFGKQEFTNYYIEEAMRFMRNNGSNILFSKAETPEILFVEQRLLAMCAKEKNLVAQPFINAVWSPAKSRFVKHDTKLGEWMFFKLKINL